MWRRPALPWRSPVGLGALLLAGGLGAGPAWAQDAGADIVAPAATAPEPLSAAATQPEAPPEESPGDEEGFATWYGPGFHGKRTASGERYNMHALTAAHPTLPFGTMLRVRSLLNGKQVTVRVNDRGPFTGAYIIDLSRAAAQAIGLLGVGTKEVVLSVLPTQARQ